MIDFIKNSMNKDVYNYISTTLLKRLSDHLEDVIGKEVLPENHSDIEDVLKIVYEEAPGDNKDINWSVKPLYQKDVVIPRLIYWRIPAGKCSKIVTLNDLVIPIGQGYNKEQELKLFFLTLDSKFITVDDHDFFIAIPVYNTILEVKEDFRKIFEFIEPTEYKERIVLATSYFHKQVVSNNEKYLKAFKPGFYQLSPIEYRDNFGYITDPDKDPIEFNISNTNLKQLYRQDKISINNKIVHISEITYLLRKKEENFVIRINDDDVFLDDSVEIIESGIYRQRYEAIDYQYKEFDEELMIRRQFSEFDAITFNTELEAIRALKKDEIHRYEISPTSKRPIGVSILDLFGFKDWYKSQFE